MSQPIFNSLGSNYSWQFAVRALRNIFWVPARSNEKLKESLEKRFAGRAYLFLKGRDAIEFSLLAAKKAFPDRNLVFTQAFACFAIEEGIVRAGLEPKYVDIEVGRLNLSVAGLEKARLEKSAPLAVLVQHSLGSPADIKAIASWCRQHQVLLIEDLAQAFGGHDSTGEELGTHADIVVTSFGRDKVIDAITGGSCIIKNNQAEIMRLADEFPVQNKLSWLRLVRNLKYPFVTQLIRSTYRFGIGKAIHWLAKMMGIIKTPLYSPTTKFSSLYPPFADLAHWQLVGLDKQLNHRRKIASIYFSELMKSKKTALPLDKDQIDYGANLRFPVVFSTPGRLKTVIKKLEEHNYYLSDRWYRQPVDCSSLECDTLYVEGSCPEAESVSERILNLPTHPHITPDIAKKIAEIISH